VDPFGARQGLARRAPARQESPVVSGRISRRELLFGLLGPSAGAAAFAACSRGRSRSTELAFPGRIVGPDVALGHRLRDGDPALTAPPEQTESIPVLVLGAGAAGLSAAWALARGGARVKVLELERAPGGTAMSGRSSRALRFPWGAHYLPAPAASNPELLELLRDTGTLVGVDPRGRPIFDEAQLCRAPKERIFIQGFWYEGLFPAAGAGPDDLAELRRFRSAVDRLIAFRDDAGRRAFAVPIAHSTLDDAIKRLDRQSFLDWLRTEGFRSKRLLWYLEYACRDDFGTELSETSAWAGLHYFAARTEQPGEESAEFLTWPEGNGFLVDHLAKSATIELGTAVTRIEPAPDTDGKKARVLGFSSATGRTKAWIAERVIFALPSFLRTRLITGYEVSPYPLRYSPWLVANIELRERPPSRGFDGAWDNVIHQSRSLGYVDAGHQLLGLTPEKQTVWTWYLPFSGPDERASRAELQALSHADAAQVIGAELERCHLGFAERVERIDVMRWGHAMVRPVPGAIWSPARAKAAEPVGPIHFAHTDLSAMALFEEAFHHGVRAAKEVLASGARLH
jgi:phytoene dehydrogenase-like protein